MNEPINPDKISATCLFVIAIILVAISLSYTRAMMIPFAFSVFLALILKPIVQFIQINTRLPRILVVIGVISATVALLIGSFYVLGNTFAETLDSIEQYNDRLWRGIAFITSTLQAYGVPLDEEKVRNFVRSMPLLTYLQNVTGHIVSIISNTLIIFVFVFFILAGQRTNTHPKPGLFWKIDQQIRRYLLVKAVASVVTGVLVWITLAVIGVDLALMFGFLTIVLNFIPTIGSIIATLLPIPIVVLQFDSPAPMILAVAIPTAIQFMIGTVTEPKILGDSLDIHPVVILLSLMFWGIIWGPVGMFLAVPITAAMKLSLECFHETKGVAAMMSGRSPILE